MKNKFRTMGNVVIMQIRYKEKCYYTKFNVHHLSKVKNVGGTWQLKLSRDFMYVTVNRKDKTFRLHRVITDASEGLHVDHDDHDTLNNLDNNLKVGTHTDNMRNKRTYKSNKSRCSGVGKQGAYWVTTFNGNYIGCSKNFAKAVYMRKFEEIKYKGA